MLTPTDMAVTLRRYRFLAVAIGLVFLMAPSTVQSESEWDKLSPSLRSRLSAEPDSEDIRFSVVMVDNASQRRRLSGPQRRRRVRHRVESVLLSVPDWRGQGRLLENVAGFSGTGDKSTIEALARHASVERVYLDIPLYPLLAEGVPLIGADQAAVLGVTGNGISVAVLDGGVMRTHPDLDGDVVSEICFCEDSLGVGCCPDGNLTMTGPGSAADVDGHGTKVSGIITSEGILASPGVAPGAGIVAVKVYGSASAGTSVSSIDSALDWILTEHISLAVRVINISLGSDSTYSDEGAFPCTGTLTESLVGDLAVAGVATFIASGNAGASDGLSFPACIPDAISVGGVYDANVGSVTWSACTDFSSAVDTWVCHTNSSPTLDLLAPDWRTQTTALGGGVTSLGGTSAASPYAAGLAALLFEQDPSRTPAEVHALLASGAPMVTDPDTGLSFPRVDVSDQFPVCGDGEISGNEECDDGNTLSGDCCSPTCAFEVVSSLCDDHDLCTTGESCDGAGLCGSGSVVICDDGLFCTGVENCDAALGCQSGAAPGTDDGIACTLDSCDEIADAVVHTPDSSACDNGLFCDGGELCDSALGCQSGAAPGTDDGIACTLDSCDEIADAVVHTPDSSACDNGLFCDGGELCDSALGCQSGAAPGTDDGIACTVDSCDEGVGGVLHAPDDGLCDDLDPCTADLCDAALGCQNEPIPACPVGVPTGGSWIRALLVWSLVITCGLWGSGFRLTRSSFRRV